MQMTAPSAAPASTPFTLRPDPTRWVFRLPLALLAIALTAALATLCARILAGPGPQLSSAAQASLRIAPTCALVYAYIRWVYVARTRLVISREGVTLHQPLASWTCNWPDIADITAAAAPMLTHRGGIPSAAILHLRAGGRKSIPDIFALSCATLTARLVASLGPR